jgi:hypothetical protein
MGRTYGSIEITAEDKLATSVESRRLWFIRGCFNRRCCFGISPGKLGLKSQNIPFIVYFVHNEEIRTSGYDRSSKSRFSVILSPSF